MSGAVGEGTRAGILIARFSRDVETSFVFHQGQKVYVPRLLLSQLRFLDRIVDGKYFGNLVETVPNLDTAVTLLKLLVILAENFSERETGQTFTVYCKTRSQNVREEILLSWSMVINVLHITIILTKMFNARSNLGTALKYGRQFVGVFLRQRMPLLDVMF